MIHYKNAIYKKLTHHKDNHLKLRFGYFQDLVNTKIEQARKKFFETCISHKFSNKVLVTPKKNFEW